MLLGSEMERMSDPARAQVVEQIHVFARVSPAQKNRIILALKSRHEKPISPFERYSRLEEEYQDVLRGELIFGLHVHVGIDSMVQSYLIQLSKLGQDTSFCDDSVRRTLLKVSVS